MQETCSANMYVCTGDRANAKYKLLIELGRGLDPVLVNLRDIYGDIQELFQ